MVRVEAHSHLYAYAVPLMMALVDREDVDWNGAFRGPRSKLKYRVTLSPEGDNIALCLSVVSSIGYEDVSTGLPPAYYSPEDFVELSSSFCRKAVLADAALESAVDDAPEHSASTVVSPLIGETTD